MTLRYNMNNSAIEYLQGDDTAKFLQKISTRLSSREDCRYTEFKVTISQDHISMDPLIYVFPDTHHRADIDKMSILTYVIQTLSQETQKLSAGTYKYEYVDSYKRKRRRWAKIAPEQHLN